MIEYVFHNPRWWFMSTDEMSLRPEGHYFWDETGTSCCGPYRTKEKAHEQMEAYMIGLESDE